MRLSAGDAGTNRRTACTDGSSGPDVRGSRIDDPGQPDSTDDDRLHGGLNRSLSAVNRAARGYQVVANMPAMPRFVDGK